MSSLSETLTTIHKRTPTEKMVVLQHNIHIKLLFPVLLWFITLPFITPSVSATLMAILSGIFIAFFFMPAPYWSENKISTPRHQFWIKVVALIGFLIVTIMAFISAIISHAHTSWFLVQYMSIYMTTFLVIAMILKATKSYKSQQLTS